MKESSISAISATLAESHWAPMREKALLALDKGLKKYQFMALDRILRVFDHDRTLSTDQLHNIFDAHPSQLKYSIEAIIMIDPASPLTQILSDARFRHRNGDRGWDLSRVKFNYNVSIPIDHWPLCYQYHMRSLKTVSGGRFGTIRPATLKNVQLAIGQVLLSAQRKELAMSLNPEAYRAWLDDISKRPIQNNTKASYVEAMATFVFHVYGQNDFYFHLMDEITRFKNLAKDEPSLKKNRYQDNPITDLDLKTHAHRLLTETRTPTDVRNFRKCYIGSAALTLLRYYKVRRLDLTMILLGVHFSRNSYNWNMDYILSKNQGHIFGSAPNEANIFLDNIVCFGGMNAGEDLFWETYHANFGKPIFRHPNGQTLSDDWFYRLFKDIFNEGPHMVRTASHEEGAPFGDIGRSNALTECGQNSDKTATHYEVFAPSVRLAVAKGILVEGAEQVINGRINKLPSRC
jgi:hypothetical protein